MTGPGARSQISTGGGASPQWRQDGRELFYMAPDNHLMAAPVSLNGHGVRETTFVGYLTRIGIQREGALALSLTGGALIVLFSMTGAAAYLARKQHPAPEAETTTV